MRRARCRASPIPKARKRAGASAQIALAASNGFRGGYATSRWGISVSVLAGEGTGMERDYDFSSAVFGENLTDPETLGRSRRRARGAAPQSAQGFDREDADHL